MKLIENIHKNQYLLIIKYTIMEKVVHQSKYLTINHDDLNKIFINYWLSSTANMTNEEFKKEIGIIIELAEQFSIRGILVNSIDYMYPITPEIQDWYNEFTTSTLIKIGVSKMVIIVSTDFLSRLSVEQMFDDQKGITIAYYSDIKNAMTWLSN